MLKRAAGETGFITGTITPFIRREATNFVVGDLEPEEAPHLRVVGTIVEDDLWREVIVGGTVERDEHRGGLQLKVAGVLDTELTEAQMRAYLGSGLVKHVGPAIAQGILATFGSDTLRIIVEEPERLVEVRGISANLLPETRASLATTMHLAGIVGLLDPLGISLGVCRQIARRHGSQAVSVIRANPWRLAMDFNGVAFPTADTVALRLGASPDAPERAEAALAYVVAQAARSGHTVVPRPTAAKDAAAFLRRDEADLGEALMRLEARGVLASVVEPDGVASPEIAKAEARLAEALAGLLARTMHWDAAIDEADIAALEAASGITFDDTQRAAVAGVLSRGVTVLTGGPGTGKTTIVRAVCDLAERHGLSVALMSFTGKAAKRLSEATGRTASTIHRYLKFSPDGGFSGPDQADDVIIVDEVSMLDVSLADELASWLTPRARLILVGDVDQLPSIGAGNVLGDLVTSGVVPVFRLSIIHRTGEGSGIPELARSINEGEPVLPYDGLTTHFVGQPGPNAIADWIGAFFARRIDRADEYQVLAPMKAGAAGVDNLNGVIARTLRSPAAANRRGIVREAYDMRPGDRIIWTVNDKDLGLFNGEIGTLIEVRSNGGALVEFVDQSYAVPPEKVASNCFSLAYALTIHKGQGSEFETVITVMDNGAQHMLTRRLFYTAVSRARQNAVVIGQEEAVARAVRRHEAGHRRTALSPLLVSALAALAPKHAAPIGDAPFE